MKKILIANQKGGCGKTSIAVTLAAALTNNGSRVAIADADPQKSSLRWLKFRPDTAAVITGVDWRDTDDIGDFPKKDLDYLIIDAPGAVAGEKAEKLISECDVLFIPVLPSFFDIDSTKRFLKSIHDIKRIRKGKVEIHLIANRVRPQMFDNNQPSDKLVDIFRDIGQLPIAYISEKSVYQSLADEALTVFDKPQKFYRDAQVQWLPILKIATGQKVLGDGAWF
ncbi:MAG: ParA family protein [Moraxella sp.]|nr:ParA family protein [Moraxella sp.]